MSDEYARDSRAQQPWHSLIDFSDPYSAEPAQGRLQCAFGAPKHTLIARNAADVRPLLSQVQTLAQQGHWCVGYLRYEAAAAFDPAFKVHAAEGPLAWFGVHEQALPWPEDAGAAPAASAAMPPLEWTQALSRADFDANMARIHQAIANGELYQINYTTQRQAMLGAGPDAPQVAPVAQSGVPRDLRADAPAAPSAASSANAAQAYFHAWRRAQPGGYGAFIHSGEEQILSMSPELFFDWQGERLLGRPMKGTAPRGATPDEDRAQALRLQTVPKERAENVMIVDLIRNDLSRIAQPFSVRVPHLLRTEALPTVWQMTSDVQARSRPGTTLADVFAALFPCGSITGAPKVSAMQLIHALEPEARGVYCGAIGVVQPGGHARFNVPIRTVVLRDGVARCGVGSGITSDAQAEAEWAEWQHKLAFLTRT